jgi:hypothetical protein
MATAELPRPGVEVIQTIRTASPSFLRPTLVPCIVGPAYELINVLNTDGSINSGAKYGLYEQISKAIAESSFPSPRGNIDEVDVLEDTIKTYFLAGGSLSELPLYRGSGFLAPAHVSGKALILTTTFGGSGAGLDLDGLVLVLSIDGGDDVTIQFDSTGNMLSSACAAAINAAMGEDVATVVGSGVNDRVEIASPTFGALSQVAVRAGGSANETLQIGYKAADAMNPGGHEEVVTGCGFRGQDDANGDTVTPWIEFYRGSYTLDTVETTFRASVVFIRPVTGAADMTAIAAAQSYTGVSPTYPIVIGDYFYADGVRVKSGEVMKIEDSRFKIGTINTALSTADANGNYTSKVYDPQQVGAPIDMNPFAPKYAYFVANGINWRNVVATAAAKTGTTTGTAATQATVTGDVLTDTVLNVTGLRLYYTLTVDGVETDTFFTFPASNYADDGGLPGTYPTDRSALDKVAEAIQAGIDGLTAASTTPGVSGGAIKLTTAKYGRLQSIKIKSTGVNLANSILGLAVSSDLSGTGTDVVFSSNGGIKNKTLQFQFDSNQHTYKITPATNSLTELVDLINATVGATVAAEGTGADVRKLVLTSPLAGLASRIVVLATTTPTGITDIEDILGIDATDVVGTGRPYPNAWMDDSYVLHLNSEILRNSLTGYPLDQSYDNAQIYIQYKGLRKDVSASALQPGVLKLSDVATLGSVLDPVTEENPLALGMFFAMLAAPTYEVKGLGIDEVTSAAPEGTEMAWARAAALLEAEEVYALAPLTTNEVVHSMWMTHCTVMSAPEQGGERIVLLNKAVPNRKNPTIIVSGTQANTNTATPNHQIILDSNPIPGLVAAGIQKTTFTPEDGVYVELTVASEFRRYNVANVSGSLVTINTTFTGTQNSDGFYSETALDVPVVNSAYSCKVRGASLVVPGSNPPRTDYSTLADTVAEANGLLRNRRVYELYPDSVKTVIGGIEKTIPGYFASAIVAGMIAAQPPQQGFTNFAMPVLTGVVGTEKFTKRQLNIMAGGGTYLLMQDVPGAAVYSRHQLSTNTTSVETRELSITKVVDFVAKFLRTGVRRFIGVNNVNSALLDTLGTTIHAILKFLEEAGVLNGSSVNNIVQDATNKDTVLIDVTLDVPYPCNYIRLTLVI